MAAARIELRSSRGNSLSSSKGPCELRVPSRVTSRVVYGEGDGGLAASSLPESWVVDATESLARRTRRQRCVAYHLCLGTERTDRKLVWIMGMYHNFTCIRADGIVITKTPFGRSTRLSRDSCREISHYRNKQQKSSHRTSFPGYDARCQPDPVHGRHTCKCYTASLLITMEAKASI
jgi:hypothetical protein